MNAAPAESAPAQPPASSEERARVRVAQIGARKGYGVVAALAKHGGLESLCTDFYSQGSASSGLARGLALAGRGRAARVVDSRRAPVDAPVSARTFGWVGLKNRWRVRAAWRRGAPYEAYLKGGEEFARAVAGLRWDGVDAVYAFSSACLELFAAARERGVPCLLDHETAPALIESRLVREAQQRYADWLPHAVREAPPDVAAYAERQRAEAELADVVLCPSTFAMRQAVDAGVARDKLRCLPFAVAETFATSGERAPRSGPLRVLFAGHDAIRKGLPVLVEALASLPRGAVDARGLGEWSLSARGWSRSREALQALGPVPRNDMPGHYGWADVFVLPTFSDTMGAVILEAMASGAPVIASENSGGPDLIRDGVDGFVVPVGSAGALADRISLLAGDRERLAAMSQAAREGAASFSFERYASELLACVASVCGERERGGTV